jgi:hypothetical protein
MAAEARTGGRQGGRFGRAARMQSGLGKGGEAMNFERMKLIEPELARLESSARFAGEHGASWMAVLLAQHEPLTKLVGHGAHDERLRADECYETARAALFSAWAAGRRQRSTPNREVENSLACLNNRPYGETDFSASKTST